VGSVLMLAGFLGGTITAVMEAHSWRGNAEYAWVSLSLFIWFLVVPGLIVWIVSLAKALRRRR
jgi:hypothetical protein